jgi:hypothetical protein
MMASKGYATIDCTHDSENCFPRILVIRFDSAPGGTTSTVAATANSPSAAWELCLAPGEERPGVGASRITGLNHKKEGRSIQRPSS